MTIQQYSYCLTELPRFEDMKNYIDTVSHAAVWGEHESSEIPQERIDELRVLWECCHREIKEIAHLSGLSVRRLAISFGIPIRTIENWASGRSSAPVYILLMIQECLGLTGNIISRQCCRDARIPESAL